MYTYTYKVYIDNVLHIIYNVYMGIEKKVLSLRADEELIEKLKRLAEKENRSLSNCVETILKNHLEELMENGQN